MFNIVKEFYSNKAIRDAFYRIEWRKIPDELSWLGGTKLEMAIDYMLAFLGTLGEMVIRKVLRLDDTEVLSYEIIRIYNSRPIQHYLRFLDDWYRDNGIMRVPFKGFRFIAELFTKKYLHESSKLREF